MASAPDPPDSGSGDPPTGSDEPAFRGSLHDPSPEDFDRWGDPNAPRPRGPMVAPPDASTLGLKIFLISLAMLFGGTLIGYAITRIQARNWDDFQIDGLRRSLVVSTVLIVLVSACFHLAVQGIRYDRRDRLKLGLVVGAILALLFLVNQADVWFEMHSRLAAQMKTVKVGRPEGGDLSVFLFFAMTILHALHVVGGFVPLAFVLVNAFRDRYSGASFRGVWNCALYWHFIDCVWILMAIALSVG